MKPIQARLQSRIAKRAKDIRGLERDILIIKQAALRSKQEADTSFEKLYWSVHRTCKANLAKLVADQVLDKHIISSIYWSMN